jgi:hypothetical protein
MQMSESIFEYLSEFRINTQILPVNCITLPRSDSLEAFRKVPTAIDVVLCVKQFLDYGQTGNGKTHTVPDSPSAVDGPPKIVCVIPLPSCP